MKMLMMKLMLMISSTLPFIKTPMALGTLLLMQTFCMTILINMVLSTSIISLLTFIMLIGGLMILFIYMSSLASNEKFKTNTKMMIMMISLIIMSEELMFNHQNNELQDFCLLENNENLYFMKLYNKKSMAISIMLFIYLLLTMIMVTKLIKYYEGPLRAKN
uniref:NADH dehydrogenase subunit 6 n=1 Tax=Busonia albilateralis TaxID=2479888 RepID=UPI0024116021|nr:NADH dehydrogenase subunit 6 [Busonia albilateralis]WEP24820.1 NADH dehydrogenase subunit 6 [Busonia albilateralis]